MTVITTSGAVHTGAVDTEPMGATATVGVVIAAEHVESIAVS